MQMLHHLKLLVFYTGSLGFALLLFFSLYKIFIDFPVRNITYNFKRKKAVDLILLLGKYLSLTLAMIIYFSTIFPEGISRNRNLVFTAFLLIIGVTAFWQKMKTISRKTLIKYQRGKAEKTDKIRNIDEHFKNWAVFIFIVFILISRVFYPHIGEYIFNIVGAVFWVTGLYVYQTDDSLPYLLLFIMEGAGIIYLIMILKDSFKLIKTKINEKILE